MMQLLWDGLKYGWNLITNWFSNIFSSLFTWIGNQARNFTGIGRDMFNFMWDGMKGIWSSMKSWVDNTVSWLADKLMFWRRSNDEMSSPSTSSNRVSSSIPRLSVGSSLIKSDGLAYLHAGEAVVPARHNPWNPNSNNTNTNKDRNQKDTPKIDIKINIEKVIGDEKSGEKLGNGVVNSLKRKGMKLSYE
jgi:hypothetical protein